MEFRFTAEQEAFRNDVRGFLETALPRSWDDSPGEEDGAQRGFVGSFTKQLAEKGWLTLGWPKEHGGMGAGKVQQAIYVEEMAMRSAPYRNQGVDRVGPTLMLFGTGEQKAQFLPLISRGEIWWCQGFSEPGAGSDLASLQTRAVRQGDDYVINGQKIWTSNAHFADWMILLARTDPDAPKHRGISFFLVDMKSPGMTIRPLINMGGRSGFNEVFFEDVRVPATNLVGEENRGWYIAAATLDFERSGIDRVVGGRGILTRLLAFARETGIVRDSPMLRHRLAELVIDQEVGRLLAYRVAWMQDRGLIPNAEASMSKLLGTELQQRLARTGMELLGMSGQLAAGSKWAALAGRLAAYYVESVSLTIAAGTSEINRNIMAQRGLGMPR
jgi:alkylation response protein AidB-like acyl-CoA dehydrogenase